MKDKVADFRLQAAAVRGQGTSARYPEAMKQFARTYALERTRAGASMQRVAKELGLAGQTLAYWLQTRGALGAERERAKLVPVVAVSSPPVAERSAVIVIVVGDVRIEVSDVAAATELARRLR